jgi:hypothetical protein
VKPFLFAIIVAAVVGLARAGPVADVWATAIAERPSDGRQVIFRYVDEFRRPVDRSEFPYVVVLSWQYSSESGMPVGSVIDAMYEVEDRLRAAIEDRGRAMLVLISTGENVRLWTYYATSDIDFRGTLSAALVPADRFPIEVSSRRDPTWTQYERFKRGVRRK